VAREVRCLGGTGTWLACLPLLSILLLMLAFSALPH
jgi:hypothetical protein